MDIGSIILWALPAAQIPAGWQVADGTNGTLNLTDQFVRGADEDGDVGSQGGSDSQVHTFTGDGHDHDIAHIEGLLIQSGSGYDADTEDAVASGTTDSADNRPAFNTAYYIQKVA